MTTLTMPVALASSYAPPASRSATNAERLQRIINGRSMADIGLTTLVSPATAREGMERALRGQPSATF